MRTKDNQLYNKIPHIIGTKSNELLWYENEQLTAH